MAAPAAGGDSEKVMLVFTDKYVSLYEYKENNSGMSCFQMKEVY